MDTIDHMDNTFIQRIGQIYSDSLALNFISILSVQSGFGNTCMYCRWVEYEKSPFSLRDSRASETLARMKIPGAAGRERLAFLEWGDFHPRSRFARPTIPEEKWGLLVV